MSQEIQDVIVIGGGVGGAASALRAAQYNLKVTWIMGDRETARASRGKYVHILDNMIGMHPGVLLPKIQKALKDYPEAAEHLESQALTIGTQDLIESTEERIEEGYAERTTLIHDRAISTKRDGDEYTVELGNGESVRGAAVVLSTGVMDMQPQVKKTSKSGRELDGIKWIFPWANFGRLLYCIRCEGHMTHKLPAVVIGSNEVTAQIAMMLHERYAVDIVLMTNGEELAVSDDTRKLLEHYGASVKTERIVDIYDVPEGSSPKDRVGKKGESLYGLVLEGGERVEASFAMVAMGLHRVYNDLAIALGAELEDGDLPDERKHVLIEDHSSETSVRGLFCVGDMGKRRDGGPLMKQVYTAQEYAVRAIDTVERRIRSAKRKKVLAQAD